MSGDPDGFNASDELDSGVALFATDDWIKLMVFFRSAAFDSPSTESVMRLRLGMQSQDTISPEILKAVGDFKSLEDIAKAFLNKTVDEMLGLADDVKHYELSALTVYDRFCQLIDYYDLKLDEEADTQKKLDELVKLWQAGTESGMSDKIKVRIKGLVAKLASEADGYAVRAEGLQKAIIGAGGYYEQLSKCSAEFDSDAQTFQRKYGEQSEEVTKFKKSVADLQAALDKLRKKESDEVIVLSSSPVYLIIPVFGPLILAGVDIGVGVDLAHVRADIESKVAEQKLINDKLGLAERFVTYYTNGQALVSESAKSINAILPKLDTLGRSWRAIGKDLRHISDSLSEDGASQIKGEDWNNLVATLGAAKKSWIEIGERADRFRTFAQPDVAKSVDELLKKAANG